MSGFHAVNSNEIIPQSRKSIVAFSQNYKNTDIHVYKLLTDAEDLLYSRKGIQESTNLICVIAYG